MSRFRQQDNLLGQANSFLETLEQISQIAPLNKPVLVIGSAGGSRIIGYVLQRLVAVLDWNISIDDALSMQHILARSGKIELEQDGDLADALKAQGHDTQVRDLNSGLTAIQIEKGILTGAADPRREGAAMGQ